MQKIIIIIICFLGASIFLNLLFDSFFNKNLKINYYRGPKNKKKLLKRHNQFYIKKDKKEKIGFIKIIKQ